MNLGTHLSGLKAPKMYGAFWRQTVFATLYGERHMKNYDYIVQDREPEFDRECLDQIYLFVSHVRMPLKSASASAPPSRAFPLRGRSSSQSPSARPRRPVFRRRLRSGERSRRGTRRRPAAFVGSACRPKAAAVVPVVQVFPPLAAFLDRIEGRDGFLVQSGDKEPFAVDLHQRGYNLAHVALLYCYQTSI